MPWPIISSFVVTDLEVGSHIKTRLALGQRAHAVEIALINSIPGPEYETHVIAYVYTPNSPTNISCFQRCAMRRALHKFDIKSNAPFHSCRLPRIDVFRSLLSFTELKSSCTHTLWMALSLRLPTTPRVVICEKC
jgi:hypothetical protein